MNAQEVAAEVVAAIKALAERHGPPHAADTVEQFADALDLPPFPRSGCAMHVEETGRPTEYLALAHMLREYAGMTAKRDWWAAGSLGIINSLRFSAHHAGLVPEGTRTANEVTQDAEKKKQAIEREARRQREIEAARRREERRKEAETARPTEYPCADLKEDIQRALLDAARDHPNRQAKHLVEMLRGVSNKLQAYIFLHQLAPKDSSGPLLKTEIPGRDGGKQEIFRVRSPLHGLNPRQLAARPENVHGLSHQAIGARLRRKLTPELALELPPNPGGLKLRG